MAKASDVFGDLLFKITDLEPEIKAALAYMAITPPLSPASGQDFTGEQRLTIALNEARQDYKENQQEVDKLSPSAQARWFVRAVIRRLDPGLVTIYSIPG